MTPKPCTTLATHAWSQGLTLYAFHIYNKHMKRISIMLSIPQIKALQVLARKLGLSFSETLRRAIDAYLEQQKD